MRELHEVPNVAAMTRREIFIPGVVGARLSAFPVSSISPLRRRTVSLTIPVAFPTLSAIRRTFVCVYVGQRGWKREGCNGRAYVSITYLQ